MQSSRKSIALRIEIKSNWALFRYVYSACPCYFSLCHEIFYKWCLLKINVPLKLGELLFRCASAAVPVPPEHFLSECYQCACYLWASKVAKAEMAAVMKR